MRTRLAPALLVLGVVAACSRPGPGALQLAVRSVAVDLTFSAADLVVPVEPEVIVKIIPAPPGLRTPDDLLSYTRPLPPPPEIPGLPGFLDCGVAPEGAAAQSVASVAVTGPPAPGRYGRHNTGQFTIEGAIVDLTLPFPPFSSELVTEATPVPIDDVSVSVDERFPGDPVETEYLEWDSTHELIGGVSIRTRYRLTADAIQIVERETVNQGEVDLFRPTPPVSFIELNEGEGHTWVSAGVDLDHRQAMQIEGLIERREAVDVCGTLVDTYRVTTSESMVDLATGATSGTAPAAQGEDRNVYNVATQFGGLIVQTHQQVTQRLVDPETGSPITVVYDYTSTLDATDPT